MLVAAVWEVALRFVCTPTGMRPKTAIKQNAAIPIARVTWTKENEAFLSSEASWAINADRPVCSAKLYHGVVSHILILMEDSRR